MHRFPRRVLSPFVLLLAAFGVAAATIPAASAQSSAVVSTLSGRVIDATTQSVLRGATVTLTPTKTGAPALQGATDANGEFTLAGAPGDYLLVLDYLGLPPKSQTVTLPPSSATPVRIEISMGDPVLSLAAVTVESTRTGQARALNQQRSAQNLTQIISADFSGQFPDKNIADAVKRLPGVTVETDRDTGGSEGRYVTVRGMTADFNAVTVNGMRVNVTDFDGITRRVPLDVISSDTADQIEVSKALRPDQDADSLGGAVDIKTRSAFSHNGRTASIKAALGYSSLLSSYYGYPYENPTHEAAVNVSDRFGANREWGLSLSASYRDRAFVKQRNSTTGWNGAGTAASPYAMDSFVLQHYFDDMSNRGANGSLEFRPAADHRFRLFAGYNARETNRGRQRQQIFFPLNVATAALTATPIVTEDTYTSVSARNNTVRKEVRDFDEKQSTATLTLDGESRLGAFTADYRIGYNQGEFDGGLNTALQAQFQNATSTNAYSITPGNARFPTITTSLDRLTPLGAGAYTLRSLVRGTRDSTDKEWNTAFNLKRALTLADLPGWLKAGGKFRTKTRDRDATARSFNANSSWNLLGYTGQSDIGSLLANYGAKDGATADGHYDYGYFLDPRKVRDTGELLIARGLLVPTASNVLNSQIDDYRATEDVAAGFGEAQLRSGRLTVLGGVRLEQTTIEFKTFKVVNGLPERIAPKRDYTDVTPALHLRFDQSKNLVLRAAYTEAIARPTFNQLNPRATVSTTSDTVSRGNIDLKRVSSRNFDLSAEYYLGSVGYVSLGAFHKDFKNNVFRSTQIELFEGDPNTSVTQERNARGGKLTGLEFAYDQQLRFLPAPFDGLGVTFNYTYADSSLDTGLPRLAGVKIPLFDQVRDTVNVSVYYEKHALRLRASVHQRSTTLFELATDNPIALARYEAPSTELDLTASYKVGRKFTIFVEVQNALSEPRHGYNGNERTRPDYNEYTDWAATFGIRWNL
ncbi:TonB-dependent receptor [Horticoccus sp. 23ND18S-11]|uniref:TonB-dependent receptor n=1 Tax=Horticoccus sp. 23ND18S-11 TaxID=3391832 RepID=UPI0039C9401E